MILVDVHPAAVRLPDGTLHEDARVALTHRRLRAWITRGREPLLILDEPHDGVTLETRYPLVGRPIEMPTAAGVVTVTRARGCGCGSPLKALRPPLDDDA